MATFKFKLRKFVALAAGSSAVSQPFTGINALATTWSDYTAVILFAKPTEETYNDYFKRSWAEQDGVEVYFTENNVTKEATNELEFLIYEADATATKNFDKLKAKLNEWGIFEYYDNYHKGLKRLVMDSVSIIMDMERNGKRVIHFKIKCTNILGKDIKNFDPDTGNKISGY